VRRPAGAVRRPAQEPPDTVTGGADDGAGAAAGVLGAGAAALAGAPAAALAGEPACGSRAWCLLAPLPAPATVPALGAEPGAALPELDGEPPAGRPAAGRELAAACVEPGRMNATAPAAATPAAPTVTVTVRSWCWLRWRCATAARRSARR
jgi:hypothetical protein